MNKVLITRTAPMEVMVRALDRLKSVIPNAEFYIVTQRNTEQAVREQLNPAGIALVEPGFFSFGKMSGRTRKAIREWHVSSAVIINSGTSGGSFGPWIRTLRFLGIRTIQIYHDHRNGVLTKHRWRLGALRDAVGWRKWMYVVPGTVLLLAKIIWMAARARLRHQRRKRNVGEPLRVLYCLHEARANGSGVSLMHTLAALDRTAITPFVVVPHEGELTETLRSRGIPVHQVRTGQLLRQRYEPSLLAEDLAKLIDTVPELITLMRQLDIDLVHINSLVTVDGTLAAWALGLPRIWHYREYLFPDGLWPEFQKSFLNHFASRVIAISQYCASELLDTVDPRKLRVVHNGIDLARFQPDLHAADVIRRTYGINDSDFVISVLGTINAHKGQHVVLEAMLRSPLLRSRAQVLIAGREGDSEYMELLHRLIESGGIAPRVHFIGFHPDVRPVIATSSAVVIPSMWQEPFGRVAIEAMALSRVVVASRCGGLPEIIEDGISGLLFPRGDSGALSECLESLVLDPNHAERLAAGGRRIVERQFPNTEVGRKVLEVYREVAAR